MRTIAAAFLVLLALFQTGFTAAVAEPLPSGSAAESHIVLAQADAGDGDDLPLCC
ncbi:hypothetical protein GCM10010345_68560 [Streptomyces canarius]|uniref:Secreted protein n=1 Tax=Streptomyces canarius TaxID=285453 RepID=A0ABQ3D1Q5_9ACTN|nr:hypothetical protein GCM10010345_68560 [Streptomyces canarius]